MTHRTTSFAKAVPLPKHRVSALLSSAWARVAAKHGKGRLADAIETSERSIENALAGRTLPEAHTMLNSLALDITALDEVFAELGVRVVPLVAEAANDHQTAAGIVHAMGEMIARIADGIRCHDDTLAIAKLLRPHMSALTAIVRQADKLRGAA